MIKNMDGLWALLEEMYLVIIGLILFMVDQDVLCVVYVLHLKVAILISVGVEIKQKIN